MDRGQDIGIDSILKQAWQSIDDMITHTNRLYVKSPTSSTRILSESWCRLLQHLQSHGISDCRSDPLFNCCSQQFTPYAL